MVQEKATLLFCCEAPEMFCAQQYEGEVDNDWIFILGWTYPKAPVLFDKMGVRTRQAVPARFSGFMKQE